MNRHKKPHLIIQFYSKVGGPELIFFICLMALFFIPFIFDIENRIIEPVLLTLYIFSLEYFILSFNSKYQKSLFILLTFILLSIWIGYFGFKLPAHLFSSFKLILMLISFYFITKSLILGNGVNFNTLIAGISGYILIGISMGTLVFIMQSTYPDSFSFNQLQLYDSHYFSFVTMSTLGYGDILPLTKSAKGLSILITLIGQFYMAVVVGLIIGKMIAPKEKVNE